MASLFESFRDRLRGPDILDRLRAGLIGSERTIATPDGDRSLIYADFTASGRALRQIENLVLEDVLPFYANTHTESSFCGAYTSRLRDDARAFVAAQTGAGSDYETVFAGAGATAGLNRVAALIGLHPGAVPASTDPAQRPVVFIGPYEHHSNILPWRESGAEMVEIAEAAEGGPELADLERQLVAYADRPLRVGAFSAASNVTGIVTDTIAVTRLLKRHNALAIWDFAGGGPYLPIDMAPAPDAQKDAIVISPHKFPGGPGASGVFIVRRAIASRRIPTWPGGGSVAYVSPWGHDYSPSLAAREEAGTPNIVGDIRAGLVFAVKAAIGAETIAARDAELGARAEAAWHNHPHLDLLGRLGAKHLPIFSMQVLDSAGKPCDPEEFTSLLSARTGIQARGGCSCAGTYGHHLLHIDRAASEKLRARVLAGEHGAKPGWVRLNFSYLLDDKTADYIIDAVPHLAAACASGAEKL